MNVLSPHDPRGQFILSAVGRIFAELDDGAEVVSVLVGTRTADDEEIHYYVISGRPGVQRVMMLPDSPHADQARELLAQASINLTAPDTPGE